uniref:Small acidic protein-like domain-containing protein n=2 Tax=Meloidogyne TaxID=189290 RepID=A0A915LUD1_MELJA
MYAGVPLICIPNSNDQFYNSSIVEHLGIGIYIKMLEIEEGRDENDKNSKFEYDFKEAFNEFFSHDKYSKAADNLREKIISNYYNGHKAKDSKRRHEDDEIGSDYCGNSVSKRISRDERRNDYRHGTGDRYHKERDDNERSRSSKSERRYDSDRYDSDRPRRRTDYDDYNDRRPPRRRECPKREYDEDEPGGGSRPAWDNAKVKRHAEKIQERKLLWKGGNVALDGKSGDEKNTSDDEEFGPRLHPTSSSAGNKPEKSEKKLENKWTSMIAASAKDTNQMDKFQRLMGLKKNSDNEKAQEKSQSDDPDKEKQTPSLNAEDLEKERLRQLELQRKLDIQYEMARHTQFSRRGKGLGSF